MKKNKIVVVFIVILSMFLVFLIYNKYNMKPIISSINYENKSNENNTRDVVLNIKKYSNDEMQCMFIKGNDKSNWILANKDKCKYSVKNGKYIVKIKIGNKEYSYNKEFKIDGIFGIKINNKKKYIALNDSYNLDAKLDYIGNVSEKIEYKSSNPSVIEVDNDGTIKALGKGKSRISVSTSSVKTSFEVISTDIIRPIKLDNNKEIVKCNSYSEDEVKLLDDILESRVNEAGPKTRAATAVVARFLTLEFPYKVPYFYENGRLTTNGVEAEGRYYKKGLYLGKSKEDEIITITTTSASWGCPLLNNDTNRVVGEYYPNGFDCSGYVSWILKNAGLDLGDLGAGPTDEYDYTKVGELRTNSYDLLHSGKVKVGDLIGWDGHIAVIGAMSDTKIYVTESLLPGVIMDEYDYSNPSSNFYSRYSYIIDMSKNYDGDGNLKNMW